MTRKKKKTTAEKQPLKKPVAIALYVVYLVILLEIFSRAFLVIRYEASFFKPGDYIYGFYPELTKITEAVKKSEYTDFRILILGGSVISHEFCPIDSILHRRLLNQTNRPIRIYNLAMSAHTTLDSYYKYEKLKDYRFDLVIPYHGINELRTNNCPPEMFRDDYSHYAWYHELNTFYAHPELSIVTFPLSVHLLYNLTAQKVGGIEYLPRHAPSPDNVAYGVDIKSAVPFRKNLTDIIELAKEKGRDKVLLMTFANYIPDDYEIEKFDQKQLDYADHTHPVELWGSPLAIFTGLEKHNQIIRELAAEYAGDICFFDQDSALVDGKENFRDVCHLTLQGGANFVDNLRYDLPPCLWP